MKSETILNVTFAAANAYFESGVVKDLNGDRTRGSVLFDVQILAYTSFWSGKTNEIWKMAAIKSASAGLVLPRPVTFVTGNAKKLEEVRAILGQSIPFQSLKLDLPELQGEPEDISKEKARLAAIQ
ncbi:hypothetical protein RYX36_017904, partial [Vicia faba]